MSMFDDRLTPDAFQGDEPVGVLLGSTASRVPDGPWVSEAWVAERLFERLISLGRAYRLHTLAALDPIVETALSALQCASLAEELDFVGQLVPTDAALGEVIARVMPLVLEASRGGGTHLVIAPP